jgi:exodeoxyribonuclease III
MIRLVSYNVNGVRANIKKGLWENISSLKLDILGIQETKSDEQIMLSGVADNENFNLSFHSCSMKKGYSGVATYSKKSSSIELTSSTIGVGDEKYDCEGRMVITKYQLKNPKTDIKTLTLLNGYYPQGGREGRVEYKIGFYKQVLELAKKLQKNGENVLLCGDLNTTVADIDLARPNENRKTTGCLPEEREALNWFVKAGFIDTFRYFYPEKANIYSYWDQITRARERNVGWRIDYFLADKKILPYIKGAFIWEKIMGSDHCPVGIDLDI